MPGHGSQQTATVHVGIDVGGTFTDLVAWDGSDLLVIKIPSTPPEFHLAVIEAVRRAVKMSRRTTVVHGSTVATNALLQRRGEPVAFVTTEGFRDMLLIGRQNRPKLYALRVERPKPVTPEENWFTVRERVDAHGNVVEPLTPAEVSRLVEQIRSRGLRHVAVCLLFSFVSASHEWMIRDACEAAGMTVSLSSDVLPEFCEYERSSTTTINASLRPTVQRYLELLEAGLTPSPGTPGEGGGEGSVTSVSGAPIQRSAHPNPLPEYREREKQIDLRIMHSGGGTLSASDAAKHAARLVLSGPAGGVIGAGFVAEQEGFADVITYDMGGTSTDVATVLDGRPQWTTRTTIDGLPIGLPMFDIHTVGAGGGSIAYVDPGGALRVGPQSAGAVPGPASYGRGGTEPTVTDANLVLGRILPDRFLGGAMGLDVDAAHRALEPLAKRLNRSLTDAALGVVTVVESNMAHAVRAVTSRRGHDPRGFALVCFGGAGGLHACGLADALDVGLVVVPPYSGVLSALGMIVAPPVVDVSQTVVNVGGSLDDAVLADLFGRLVARSGSALPDAATETIERFADVRFKGQSHEVTVRVDSPTLREIERTFHAVYRALYGRLPEGRAVEIVSLRVRRSGPRTKLPLPQLPRKGAPIESQSHLTDDTGQRRSCRVAERSELVDRPASGPILVVDAEATTYVPSAWRARVTPRGSVVLERG